MAHVLQIDEIGEDEARLAALRQDTALVQSARGLEVLRYRPALETIEHKDLQKGASFQRRLDEIGITDGEERAVWERMLVTAEGERRRHLRLPLTALLRGPHIARLRQDIRQIVDDAIDEIEDLSDANLMAELAWKVPSRVYCHLVSAPFEQAEHAAHLSDSTLAPILTSNRARRQESIDAFVATYDFVAGHLAERRRKGLGDDFTSIMIRQQMEGRQSEEEMIFEGIALLQASIDNTVHQIGLVLGTLLEVPDRWRALHDDLSLVPAGVEEAMRINPRFGTVFRYAPAATLLGDHPVPADSWVFVSVRSANLDPAQFDDPTAFRLDRGTKRALQFGGGPYSCLGQVMARTEAHEVVSALCQRFPQARIDGTWSRAVSNAVTETSRLRASLV
ncbi:MAG: cytochrome P450 [Mesorhizobium sp.]|nr:cytochrome P450 [Mesorhizobium sp.]